MNNISYGMQLLVNYGSANLCEYNFISVFYLIIYAFIGDYNINA